jgi:hypothetical protein
MTMTEPERAHVLQMIEAGKINAADGIRLLDAVKVSLREPDLAGRWIRIRVTNLATQRPKVSVNLPLAWVALGVRIGSQFSPELAQIDMNEILDAIRSGAEGRIIEVEDLEDEERVEVFVD